MLQRLSRNTTWALYFSSMPPPHPCALFWVPRSFFWNKPRLPALLLLGPPPGVLPLQAPRTSSSPCSKVGHPQLSPFRRQDPPPALPSASAAGVSQKHVLMHPVILFAFLWVAFTPRTALSVWAGAYEYICAYGTKKTEVSSHIAGASVRIHRARRHLLKSSCHTPSSLSPLLYLHSCFQYIHTEFHRETLIGSIASSRTYRPLGSY